jgi:hypothetical protein
MAIHEMEQLGWCDTKPVWINEPNAWSQ